MKSDTIELPARSIAEERVPVWQSELEKISNCPQRQDSLSDQLKDLRVIANRFGFYDAADFLQCIDNIKFPK